MIAKLEMTLSTAQQKKDKFQMQKKTQTIGATIKNESTTIYTSP